MSSKKNVSVKSNVKAGGAPYGGVWGGFVNHTSSAVKTKSGVKGGGAPYGGMWGGPVNHTSSALKAG